MGDTPVPETIAHDSDEAAARTIADQGSEEVPSQNAEARNPIAPFPEVLAAFQQTLPVRRGDLPQTSEDHPGEPVPPDPQSESNEGQTIAKEAEASGAAVGDAANSGLPGQSVPERIGRFPVEKLLGTGNFGNVYLARDLQLDILVAIKVPRPDRFPDREYYDTFLHEARVAAQINHSGIVRVFQVDRDPNAGSFVVLEYIDGISLAKLLQREQFTATRAVEMLRLIAVALACAHELGLVHRDLKPENILLDKSNRPHIADFGLAIREDDRWPSRWQVAGTPHYMAPEQVRGESHRLDGRTDLWALGVILYRMLTGVQPFEGRTRRRDFRRRALPRARAPAPAVPEYTQGTRTHLPEVPLQADDRPLRDQLTTWSRSWTSGWSRAAALDQTTQTGLASPGEAPKVPRDPDTEESPARPRVRVRPKGLRAFDADDADYFLRLLPGPRDRNDLPESIRFWKARIEPGKRDDPFAVGLLCGPSGSGKTSLVRAGLSAQLDPDLVLCVYVEATPETTEARLLAALERVTTRPSAGRNLAMTIAGIRNHTLLSPGPKVLIVLDQFEQWLLADREPTGEGEQLVAALRQCDGFNVQCLILVRDDFGMAAARFMRSLEIRLIESHNFATVEPFDPVHAQGAQGIRPGLRPISRRRGRTARSVPRPGGRRARTGRQDRAGAPGALGADDQGQTVDAGHSEGGGRARGHRQNVSRRVARRPVCQPRAQAAPGRGEARSAGALALGRRRYQRPHALLFRIARGFGLRAPARRLRHPAGDPRHRAAPDHAHRPARERPQRPRPAQPSRRPVFSPHT